MIVLLWYMLAATEIDGVVGGRVSLLQMYPAERRLG